MTIKELQEILEEEIKKGNGEKKVGYISFDEGCLCTLTKDNIGDYTEEHSINGQVYDTYTSFIIGNLIEINTEEDY